MGVRADLQEKLLNQFPWARPDSDKKSLWNMYGFAIGDG